VDTKQRILDTAQRLIQERGVNGFSYADIAKEVGVSKASLHHHFATKTDLVVHLLELYTTRLANYLTSLNDTEQSAKAKLFAYCDVYRQTLSSERVCLGGMLSAEALTLDAAILPKLERFFAFQHQWLTAVLKQGVQKQEFSLSASAEHQACMLIAALQGALVVSRAAGHGEFFEQSMAGLIGSIQ